MHPNFSGIWKLILGESDSGFLPQPLLCVDTIEHENVELRIRIREKDANGDLTVGRNLTIGGEPVEIMILGRARRVRAIWDEATLVIETISEVRGAGLCIDNRLTLDADAQWITIERLHEFPGGDVGQRLRFQPCEPAADLDR